MSDDLDHDLFISNKLSTLSGSNSADNKLIILVLVFLENMV